MFPNFEFNTETSNLYGASTNTASTLERVYMLDFDSTDGTAVVRIVDGKPVEAKTLQDKVSMYIQTLLRTAINKYRVYDNTDFGVSYFNYMGLRVMPKSTMHSEIQREIIEKVEALDVVDTVSDFRLTTNKATLTINFSISLNDGTTHNIIESVVI